PAARLARLWPLRSRACRRLPRPEVRGTGRHVGCSRCPVLAGVVGGALFFSRGHLEVKVNAEQVVNGLPAANCAAGDYPSINISNTGEDPIEWQLSTDTRDVVLFSSSQGSLQPGESIIIRLLGNFSGSQVTVTVHSGAGSESVTIVCT